MKLEFDRHSFPIVNNAAELTEAKMQGYPNVKVNCPNCGRQHLVATGSALEAMGKSCGECNPPVTVPVDLEYESFHTKPAISWPRR
jgi:hypothetical protein